MINIGVAAVSGHYGTLIAEEVLQTPNATLSGGSVRSQHEALNQDLGVFLKQAPLGVKITDQSEILFSTSDVVIEFSRTQPSLHNLATAQKRKKAYVCGTTGFSKEELARFAAVANDIPVLWAPNMSLGANILSVMVEMLAKKLDNNFDIEILDIHHRHKVDAPSGTALAIGKRAAAARGVDFDEMSIISRNGHTGERKPGQIGFASLRAGSVIAEAHVYFATIGERLELIHRSEDSVIYAKGAVKAALWLAQQKPGLYTMYDVLGLHA